MRLRSLIHSSLSAAALVVVCTQAAAAGTGTWTRTGPFGGGITAVVLDPASSATVYASSLNGIFKSTDGGTSWSNPAGEGKPGLVNEMAIGTDGVLYAKLGSGRSGVFKSTDAGASWAEVNASRANAIAVDRSISPTVYLGVSGQGVLRSSDGGTTWTSSDTGIEGLAVQAIAVDPVTPSTVYGGTSRDGVFKSTDSGQNWVAFNTGIESTRVRAIAIDPVTPSTVFVATDGDGVLKSADSGVSWSSVSTGLPTAVETLALDPVTPTTVFAGAFGEIFKSTNSGALWSSLTLPGVGVQVDALAVDPSSTSTVYAGTGAGVWKTTNGGTSWTEQNTGLLAFHAGQIVADPTTPATLYATSAASGIFKSTDSGTTWLEANSGLPSREIQTNGVGLTSPAGTPRTLYVSLESDIFKSTDGGATWIDALLDPAVFLVDPFVMTIAVDPADRNTVFAGNFGSTHDTVDFEAGVYRTTDGGSTWEHVFTAYSSSPGFGSFQPTDTVVDPANPARIYVGSIIQHPFPVPIGWNVVRSLDGGDTWQEVLAGTGFKFPKLAVDPFVGTVFCAVESGNALEIHKSIDFGATWTQLPINTLFSCASVNSLQIDPGASVPFFLNCFTSLNVSTDSGVTWNGLPTNGLAAAIDTDAGAARSLTNAGTTPRTLHMGTFGGVFSFTADLAGIQVSKSDGLIEIESGPLTYTIAATNSAGPDHANGITVEDALPAFLTCSWACAASGGATCTASPPPGNLADGADLPRGGSVTYTGTCNLDDAASGTLSNTASVQTPAAVANYDPQNGIATDQTLILDIGACGEFNDRHLTNQVVSSTVLIAACNSILAGDGFVVDPIGNLTLMAPIIELSSGFSVQPAGVLSLENATP